MRRSTLRSNAHINYMRFVTSIALGGVLWIPVTLVAQATGSGQPASSQDQDLRRQLAELRAQMARLQAALEKQALQTPRPASSATPAPATGGGGMMGEMGAGGMGGGKKKGMSGSGMGMMEMHKGEMGMPPAGKKMADDMMSEMGMGRMSGASGASSASGSMSTGGAAAGGGATSASGMAMGGAASGSAAGGMGGSRPPRSVSSLPGVPGASHLYHIGSTDFFLDQPQIALAADQELALNRIKERALVERSTAERRVEQGEQELWELTGADQPDAAKIQAKVQEVEQLRSSQRMAFIRAVGDATRVLTTEQRNELLGANGPRK
jgi:hypothetical protein